MCVGVWRGWERERERDECVWIFIAWLSKLFMDMWKKCANKTWAGTRAAESVACQLKVQGSDPEKGSSGDFYQSFITLFPIVCYFYFRVENFAGAWDWTDDQGTCNQGNSECSSEISFFEPRHWFSSLGMIEIFATWIFWNLYPVNPVTSKS